MQELPLVANAARIQSRRSFMFQPGETDRWENVPLQIPSLPPSRLVGCNIIDVSYVIKVHTHVRNVARNHASKFMTTSKYHARLAYTLLVSALRAAKVQE